MVRLTLERLVSTAESDMDRAIRMFEIADVEDQALILQLYRDGHLRRPSDLSKGFHNSPDVRLVKVEPLFKTLVGYHSTKVGEKRIDQILGDIQRQYRTTEETANPLERGADLLATYCQKYPCEDHQAWVEVAYLERQKLALHFYLNDLDDSHKRDITDERHEMVRSKIEAVLQRLYDPRRADADADRVLDCYDSNPFDRNESQNKPNPEQIARRIREEFGAGGGDPIHFDSINYLEDRGRGNPIAIVVPIVLLASEPGVDLSSITKKEQEIEDLMNKKLMPEDWRRHFQLDVVFYTDVFDLLDQTPTPRCHHVTVNQLQTYLHRASSNEWSQREAVGVYAHEIGHLLGWPDKYHEKRSPREHTLDPAWIFWHHGDLMANDTISRYIASQDLAVVGHRNDDNQTSRDDTSVKDDLRFSAVKAAMGQRDVQKIRELIEGHETEDSVYLFALAVCLEETKPDQAELHYRHSIRLMVKDGVYDISRLLRVAQFYERRGRQSEAKGLYEEILKVTPNNATVLCALALLGFKDPRDVIRQIRPSDYLDHYCLARLYSQTGDYEKAVLHFKESFDGNGKTSAALIDYPGPDRYIFYAKALQKLGRSDMTDLTVVGFETSRNKQQYIDACIAEGLENPWLWGAHEAFLMREGIRKHDLKKMAYAMDVHLQKKELAHAIDEDFLFSAVLFENLWEEVSHLDLHELLTVLDEAVRRGPATPRLFSIIIERAVEEGNRQVVDRLFSQYSNSNLPHLYHDQDDDQDHYKTRMYNDLFDFYSAHPGGEDKLNELALLFLYDPITLEGSLIRLPVHDDLSRHILGKPETFKSFVRDSLRIDGQGLPISVARELKAARGAYERRDMGTSKLHLLRAKSRLKAFNYLSKLYSPWFGKDEQKRHEVALKGARLWIHITQYETTGHPTLKRWASDIWLGTAYLELYDLDPNKEWLHRGAEAYERSCQDDAEDAASRRDDLLRWLSDIYLKLEDWRRLLECLVELERYENKHVNVIWAHNYLALRAKAEIHVNGDDPEAIWTFYNRYKDNSPPPEFFEDLSVYFQECGLEDYAEEIEQEYLRQQQSNR